MKKRIDQLKIGDLVDLEGDTFADANRDHQELEFEFSRVIDIERESEDCVRVDFDHLSCGFPPAHIVTVEP